MLIMAVKSRWPFPHCAHWRFRAAARHHVKPRTNLSSRAHWQEFTLAARVLTSEALCCWGRWRAARGLRGMGLHGAGGAAGARPQTDVSCSRSNTTTMKLPSSPPCFLPTIPVFFTLFLMRWLRHRAPPMPLVHGRASGAAWHGP